WHRGRRARTTVSAGEARCPRAVRRGNRRSRAVRQRRAATAGSAARRTRSAGAMPPSAQCRSRRGPRPRPSAWPGRPGGALARAPRQPRRTGWRWRRNTASTRRSWLPLPEPLRQQLAQAAQLLVTEILVGYELGQEQLGRAVEHFVYESAQRAATGGRALHQRTVAVGAPLAGVADVALLLERAQHGEDGRVREVVAEPLTHLGDGRGACVPQHAHHVELAVGECDRHGRLHLLTL